MFIVKGERSSLKALCQDKVSSFNRNPELRIERLA
jgi:hypothetical protein